MGGRKNAAPLFIAAFVILLIFVAGAVMLGIGISKAVQTKSCDTTSTSTSKPASAFEKDAATPDISPYFVNIKNLLITSDDFNNNFGLAFNNFRAQVQNALNDGSVVSLITLTADQSSSATIGIVAIIYRTENAISADAVQAKLNNAGLQTIDAIGDSNYVPDPKNQFCSSVSEKIEDKDYTPCAKKIVFAIDNSVSATPDVFRAQNQFLAKDVFAANWNHFERLGLVWFNIKPMGRPFGYYTEKTLKDIQRLILTTKQARAAHSLPDLFTFLASYQPDESFPEVNYVVFISKLDSNDVDSIKGTVDQLKQHGNVTFILLGDQADPNQEQTRKLTNHYIVWMDPDVKTSPRPDNWNDRLWTTAYGCDEAILPSSPATEPSFPASFPTDAPTTTPVPEIPIPCAGSFVLGLDTSKAMTSNTFKNQNAFVPTLFTATIFNHFERMTLGYFGRYYSEIPDFNYYNSVDDIKEFIDTKVTKMTKDNAKLRLFLQYIYEEVLFGNTQAKPITVIAFISNLDDTDVAEAKEYGDKLIENGVRIALVNLGNVNQSKMQQITPNIYTWDAENNPKPSDDYQTWFKQVVNCPGSNVQEQFKEVVQKRSVENELQQPNPSPAYPCKDGTIVLAFDISFSMNANQFATETGFLANKLFSKSWNQLSRLTLIDYSSYLNVNTFTDDQSVDDVLEIILDSEQFGSLVLHRLFVALDDWRISPSPEPIHTIIFISDLNETVTNTLKPLAKSLKSKNFDLTLIAIGNNPDLKLFNQLSPNVIAWNTAKANAPANWNETFWKAFGCDHVVPTYPTGPYPCLGNIIIAFDSSNSLGSNNYQREIDFLTDDVFNDGWTNLNRLAVIDYSNFASTQSYSTFSTVQDVRDFIETSYHSSYAPSLYHAIQAIDINNLASSGAPTHSVIFVSTISQDIVDKVRPFVVDLQNKGCTFTFVAAGNNVQTYLLKQLSPQVIKWNINQELQPANWELLFWSAYGCSDWAT
ncbi:hypothetical protein M3Y97_00190700 [Aphelenchoides bicaudatus]|nr:hypothetical protein M3Y97_00190700 [Aphelenchoides bicaudatus]